MLKEIKFSPQKKNLSLLKYLEGNSSDKKSVQKLVANILKKVRMNGDKALLSFIKKYENKKIKKISDKELIYQFKNEISVPSWVISEKKNNSLNKFFNNLAKISRKFI